MGKPHRVLVIDDDAGIRESLQDMLAMENFDCSVAETAEEGLELAETFRPEVIVTDVQLPDMSGYQVCQNIKKDEDTRDTRVVMITGRFTEPDDRVQGLELGADDFFIKPFNPVYFVARLRSLLRPAFGNPEVQTA